MAGLPAFYFFMVDVMTDMGTDVLGSCVGNLDVGLFVMSVVTPVPVDLELGIGDRNVEQGSYLPCSWALNIVCLT